MYCIENILLKSMAFYNEQLTYDVSPSLLMGYYLNVVIFKCPCTYGLNNIYTIDTLLVPFVSSVTGGIFVKTLWNDNFSFEWSLGTICSNLVFESFVLLQYILIYKKCYLSKKWTIKCQINFAWFLWIQHYNHLLTCTECCLTFIEDRTDLYKSFWDAQTYSW